LICLDIGIVPLISIHAQTGSGESNAGTGAGARERNRAYEVRAARGRDQSGADPTPLSGVSVAGKQTTRATRELGARHRTDRRKRIERRERIRHRGAARVAWIESVNSFWFVELEPDDWFSARPELDAQIRARFGSLYADLKAHPPGAEQLQADGHIAAVIVFDQFSRNLFGQSAEAFATDELALNLARHAVDEELDRALRPRQRQFLYMPFMHSEAPEMQTRSLMLFSSIGIPGLIGYATQHKEIIDRFGRFPHRNAALGRTSTPEEREFLLREPGHT
jgi:uncharacterized protein (DUF924 family)